MAVYNGVINKVSDTHTLEEFISIANSIPNKFDYNMFCMIEKRDGVDYPIYNVLDDYMAELKDRALEVTLTAKERDTYIYNPKLLSDKLYGTTLWYHMILRLNNLCNIHEFTIPNKKLWLLKPQALLDFLQTVYNSEYISIDYYNSKHQKDTATVIVRKNRI